MRTFEVKSTNDDGRRTLHTFLPSGIPSPREMNLIVVGLDPGGSWLGRHSHPFEETFFLVWGSCEVVTWTESEGLRSVTLQAPVVFSFEPGEEHALGCTKETMLVSLLSAPFASSTTTPATHLKP